MTKHRKMQPDQQSHGLLQVSTKNGIIAVSSSSSVNPVHGLLQHHGKGQPALPGRSSLKEVYSPPKKRIYIKKGVKPDKTCHGLGYTKNEII